MTPPGRRQTVIVLIAAPLAVLALVIMFRSGTPTVPEIGAPTPIVASQQPAPRLLPSPAAAIPAAPETPAPPASVPPPPAPEAPAPEPPAPVANLPAPAPPAPKPVAAAPNAPPPPVRSRDSNPSAPAPTAPAAATPSAEPTGETWMRKVFGVFLNLIGPPESELSEPQRDALFAEFLAWRRARTSAVPGQP